MIAITNCSTAPLRTKDEKLSLPLKGNDLGQTVEERDAITSPQSSGSSNSRFGVQDDDLTNTNDPPSGLMIQDHTDSESAAKLQEDEDTYDDDPFSTYDEETRSCSRTAKSTPKLERSLHGLFQR